MSIDKNQIKQALIETMMSYEIQKSLFPNGKLSPEDEAERDKRFAIYSSDAKVLWDVFSSEVARNIYWREVLKSEGKLPQDDMTESDRVTKILATLELFQREDENEMARVTGLLDAANQIQIIWSRRMQFPELIEEARDDFNEWKKNNSLEGEINDNDADNLGQSEEGNADSGEAA